MRIGELFATTLTGTLLRVTVTLVVTPVNLTSFTWTKKNNGIELTWETRNEIDVQQYEVESSTNGTDFRQIGIVKANNSRTYSFNHLTSENKFFYRLRILDVDGKFEYSKIIQAFQSTEATVNFVRPSVIANHTLNLLINESYDQVQMINMQGREMWRKNLNGRTGALQYSLPSLQPGNYVVRIIGKDKTLSQKVIIR